MVAVWLLSPVALKVMLNEVLGTLSIASYAFSFLLEGWTVLTVTPLAFNWLIKSFSLIVTFSPLALLFLWNCTAFEIVLIKSETLSSLLKLIVVRTTLPKGLLWVASPIISLL